MAISESQLETWSSQGAITQFANTYATIRSALQDSTAPYAAKNYEIFLQGSYCNDTNIYADSDVDVVMKLTSTFYHDITNLPTDQQVLYNNARTPADYSFDDFRTQVLSQLNRKFPGKIIAGNKAIYIKGEGARRDADVVACASFRRYASFRSWANCSYTEGVTFWTPGGTQIINYPKQHSENCTRKHQATGQWFKPTVRILKNMRNSMIAKGYLADGIAPSYFLEGMLYNVPNSSFGGTYEETVVKAINWIIDCPDRSKLLCANEEYLLLHASNPVTWRAENLETYLKAVSAFWDA
jgi:hypothetical protein